MESDPPSPTRAPDTPATRVYRWWWFRVLAGAAAVYVAWCAVLFAYQDRLLFHPEVAGGGAAPPPGAVVLNRELPEGGSVYAWFLPAPGVSVQHPGPLVVFCHGNAEVIDGQQPTVAGYHRLGCSVLLPEYRGYGHSAGRPAEAGIVGDALEFHRRIVQQPDVDPARVVIHGRSLGGGVAAQLAARRPPRALILESTFTSVASMAHRYWAPEFLASNPFRSDEAIRTLKCPILIFHGTNDTLIPVAHGRLNALAAGARLVEYPEDHNSFPGEHWAAYWQEIEGFLVSAGVIRPSPGMSGQPATRQAATTTGVSAGAIPRLRLGLVQTCRRE